MKAKSKTPMKFSKIHKIILEAIASLSEEDKEFVSFVRIKNYYAKYLENHNENCLNAMKTIRTQLTKLENKNYIIKKANSYAFFKESGIQQYFQTIK